MARDARAPSIPFHVCYGGEDYFLDAERSKARSWVDRDVVVYDASEGLDDAELVSRLSETSLDNARTVIVDEAQKVKETKGKPLRAFAEAHQFGDLSVVLVALVRSEKLPEMWQYVGNKPKGMTYQFPKYNLFKNDQYIRFIEERAKKNALQLDSGVSEMIVKYTGRDLYRITNELRKLHMLVGGGNKVTKAHVASVIAVTPKSDTSEVVNAVMAKNPRDAMAAFSLLYRNLGDDALVPVTAGLQRELQKVIVARAMLDRSASSDEIAAALGIHAGWCKGGFLPNVRKHDLRSLQSHMSRLCRLELDVKGSSSSKRRTLVELAILSIAG